MPWDSEKVNDIYECAEYFAQNFEHDYFEVVEAWHEYDRIQSGILPQYRVIVEIQDTWDTDHNDTYCYPVADYGREMGLYLVDTVTCWQDETVRLRFSL